MTILYTGGTFDLFHAGHVNFLKHCSVLAKTVIVSLNSDEFVTQYKGKPPILPYNQRKIILESCKYVNSVMLNCGDHDSKVAISKANPDIIAIGTDWATKDYYKQMDFTQEWLDSRKITLVYIPYGNYMNTTSIKEKILHG